VIGLLLHRIDVAIRPVSVQPLLMSLFAQSRSSLYWCRYSHSLGPAFM